MNLIGGTVFVTLFAIIVKTFFELRAQYLVLVSLIKKKLIDNFILDDCRREPTELSTALARIEGLNGACSNLHTTTQITIMAIDLKGVELMTVNVDLVKNYVLESQLDMNSSMFFAKVVQQTYEIPKKEMAQKWRKWILESEDNVVLINESTIEEYNRIKSVYDSKLHEHGVSLNAHQAHSIYSSYSVEMQKKSIDAFGEIFQVHFKGAPESIHLPFEEYKEI